MKFVPNRRKSLALLTMAAVMAPVGASAQQQDGDVMATVYGQASDLSALPEGPDVEGIISAQKGNTIQVKSADGTSQMIYIANETEIRSSGGFLGLSRDSLAREQLLNGLPVEIDTRESEAGLIAARIALKDKDLKTATMIANGTAQGFAEQTAATKALRGRVGDIDQYNIKGTTNVYFDTGKWRLSPADEQKLCSTASQANAMDNALLLVVGYTDSVGDEEYNQVLSEKRAGRVVNHLQQKCGWKPFRMLTPTGMAEADPAADNSTAAGKAQNRRVSVNILVSKSVDGM